MTAGGFTRLEHATHALRSVWFLRSPQSNPFPTEENAIPDLLLHRSSLKVGVPISLLRNINPPRLRNGTRLAVKKRIPKVIKATIINGKSKDVLIPRIATIPTDMPLDCKRPQLPIRLAFSMTIDET
ncbi:hypothetical protein EVAR_14475_1 [Eumeta japonica]|uniref:DNA helicase Pif1-like 2B domain-containing protein n=1 Tax=Eumeta variegata TaxID=151549 RepID=A0A4C1U3A8_EUMVA|nr:hypothetical protein EVAR_14475_1 [Eumeta japonica]